MSGLVRKTLYQFASSASNNGQFGSAQLGTKVLSNDPAIIQGVSGGAPSTAWLQGWLDAVVSGNNLPALEEMQGLQFVHSYELCYLLARGIPEYDSGTTYNTGDITRPAASSQLYQSLIDTNLGNALPSAVSNSNWKYLGDLAGLANPANNLYTGGTTTGSANAQLIATTSPAATSYSNGQMVSCTAGFTNTGAMTFGAGGETPIAVKKDSSSGLVPLSGGEIVLNDAVVFTKNTAGSCWVLTSGLPFGSAAFQNVGTSANNVVQLNGSSQIPAVSGALLTNLPSQIQKYNSGPTALTTVAAGILATATHGLGSIPLMVGAYLICTTTNGGYSVNDCIPLPLTRDPSTEDKNPAIYFNATQIGLTSMGAIYVANKGASGQTAITPSDWAVVFTAIL